MSCLYLKAEIKLFCALIIVFLYVFQNRIPQMGKCANKSLYFFSLAEIFLSFLKSFIPLAEFAAICDVLCVVCVFAALFSGSKNCFITCGSKACGSGRILLISACAVVALVTFPTIRHGMNISSMITVFFALGLFVTEQYNKIRVDSLTKLYNRYGMDAELKEQLRQYQREHTDSFYIIVCDLDNFKHINDTWGHPEGDRALILVAGALSKVGKRFASEVFRIGGDEFIIITDTSEEGLADSVTDAIKAELDNIDFRDDFGIGISIGVALYDGITPIDELINNADRKMYEAKKKTK